MSKITFTVRDDDELERLLLEGPVDGRHVWARKISDALRHAEWTQEAAIEYVAEKLIEHALRIV
jgi:hypothetical protein